jgi:hypothetical protein
MELGGYFELELQKGEEFHKDAIRLNLGRNALEYILLANNYTKVFIPFYTCDAVLKPFEKLSISYEYYNIDLNFNPIFDFKKIKDNEALLYTNYFGLMYNKVLNLSKLGINLIIDNSQAFYSPRISGVDCFYSARKFFGVPDGAYLYSKNLVTTKINIDYSSIRASHLLERISNGAEFGYPSFLDFENYLNKAPMLKMSNFTQRILQSINYSNVAERRINNFQYLSKHLNIYNENVINLENEDVPMFYPFFSIKKNLKKILIDNKIYIPLFWENVINLVDENTFESKLTKILIPLPIDQRYSIKDLSKIIKIIKNEYKK